MAQASCASHKEPNELLQEAHRYHVEAVTTQAEVEQLLGTLRSTGRGSEADSLAGVLEDWEEGLVEVPGFEHEHHHEGHEGHHHDHKPAPQMTDASLLDYQKSTLQAIQELKKDVEGRLAAPN
ncbi:hypothetical protein GCM10027275_23690 [Rhabdobacter roseus]